MTPSQSLLDALSQFHLKHPDFLDALAHARANHAIDPFSLHRLTGTYSLFEVGVALRDHPILAGRGALLVNAPAGGAFGFDSTSFATVLVEQSAQTSPTEAIAWFDEISAARNAPAILIASVYGLRLETPVHIGKWAILPRTIAEHMPAIRRMLDAVDREPNVVGCHAFGVYDLGEVPWRGDDANVAAAYTDSQEQISQLRLIASAIGYTDGGAPSVGKWWSAFSGPLFSNFLQPPIMTGETHPRFSFDPTDLTEEGVAAATRHLAFTGDFKKQMDIAAGRLASSRRRANELAEVLIDLAIALESIVGDDRFDLTYKLRLRSALLVSPKLEERIAISNMVRDFYAARGQVVHGKICKNPEIVDQADNLVAAIIQKVSQIGRMPDWQKLELSGGEQA